VKRLLTLLLLPALAWAQPQQQHAGEIQLALQKLNVLGTALYIAAHPDDENTRLISYLANGELVRTAYLSMTRGGGGQNLIGTEKGELMALLRTEELMAARKIDGGEQFFTSATDFGYSKSPEESFKKWGKRQVLSDMVWVIRYYRPDVLITRFNANSKRGHGHHTASAQLAAEAFAIAGDASQFPEHKLPAWQPHRLIYNTSTWRNPKLRELKTSNDSILVVNVGGYNALLGESYSEIAARSRSMHKSQGFGSSGRRGLVNEYFSPVSDKQVPLSLFDGVNTSWSRAGAGSNIPKLTAKILAQFDPEKPEGIVPDLVKLHKLMGALSDPFWADVKRKEIEQLIKSCLGLHIESTTSSPMVVVGDTMFLKVEITKRRPGSVSLVAAGFPGFDLTLEGDLKIGDNNTATYEFAVPVDGQRFTKFFATVMHPLQVKLNISGIEALYDSHITYKYTDRVKGEVHTPFSVMPKVTVELDKSVYLHQDESLVKVTAVAQQDKAIGKIELAVPSGMQADPPTHGYRFMKKGDRKTFTFKVTGEASTPLKNERAVLQQTLLMLRVDNGFGRTAYTFDYDHIPSRTVLQSAKARIVKTNVKVGASWVGYIMGPGDEVPAGLEQMGVTVVPLTPEKIETVDLSMFQAIISGIRAYNTEKWLPDYQDKIMDYVKNGGTYIVQYNTTRGLLTKDIGPYPLKLSRGRVTVEQSTVMFNHPDHKILNVPNRITSKDFDGWVQERGLYFAGEWDDRYVALFRMHDPGEEPLMGGTLLGHYGKGAFIYTGISFFRQIPAGVPGAYRLLANMISYKP
jgi:LmbE family N-acetylglucosaminyl deacetylase